MWVPVLALLLAVDPGPDSADAAFKRMEQSILKCKTFKADVEIAVGPGTDSKLKGRLLVAQGNKMRLELDGSIMGKRSKMTIVSDGAKVRLADAGPAKDQETTKQLSEIALASVSRAGVSTFFSVEFEEPEKPFNVDKRYAVTDIKLGKKETVSGKETQALNYKLTPKGVKEPFRVTVWIDVKTSLPVKRVMTVKAGEETVTIAETYTHAALDAKIDDKEFQLPK